MHKHDIFFFCNDLARDPCAAHVFRELEGIRGVIAIEMEFDGYNVLQAQRKDGSIGLFVRTADVVSNDYARYAQPMTERFSNVRTAVVVNWHEGANAPDKILTFHSTGDVPAGIYAPTAPALFSAYTRALERERQRAHLDDYRTLVEATHWSGVMFGSKPEQANAFNLPIYDLEIGSSPRCWSDSNACAALARVCVFGPEPLTDAEIAIYCGGVHFEENMTNAMLSGRLHAGHILPNHWLVSGDYAQAGLEKLQRCFESYYEPPTCLVVHKGLSSPIKGVCKGFAETKGLALLTHKQIQAASLPAQQQENRAVL